MNQQIGRITANTTGVILAVLLTDISWWLVYDSPHFCGESWHKSPHDRLLGCYTSATQWFTKPTTALWKKFIADFGFALKNSTYPSAHPFNITYHCHDTAGFKQRPYIP